MDWRIARDYLESCNCYPICTSRTTNALRARRSTCGVCDGVRSWLIRDGYCGDLSLSGLPMALALHYSDDEPGSPWTFVLYLDERARQQQRDALAAIMLGRQGGRQIL